MFANIAFRNEVIEEVAEKLPKESAYDWREVKIAYRQRSEAIALWCRSEEEDGGGDVNANGPC